MSEYQPGFIDVVHSVRDLISNRSAFHDQPLVQIKDGIKVVLAGSLDSEASSVLSAFQHGNRWTPSNSPTEYYRTTITVMEQNVQIHIHVAGEHLFPSLRNAIFQSAHVVLLCFSLKSPYSLDQALSRHLATISRLYTKGHRPWIALLGTHKECRHTQLTFSLCEGIASQLRVTPYLECALGGDPEVIAVDTKTAIDTAALLAVQPEPVLRCGGYGSLHAWIPSLRDIPSPSPDGRVATATQVPSPSPPPDPDPMAAGDASVSSRSDDSFVVVRARSASVSGPARRSSERVGVVVPQLSAPAASPFLPAPAPRGLSLAAVLGAPASAVAASPSIPSSAPTASTPYAPPRPASAASSPGTPLSTITCASGSLLSAPLESTVLTATALRLLHDRPPGAAEAWEAEALAEAALDPAHPHHAALLAITAAFAHDEHAVFLAHARALLCSDHLDVDVDGARLTLDRSPETADLPSLARKVASLLGPAGGPLVARFYDRASDGRRMWVTAADPPDFPTRARCVYLVHAATGTGSGSGAGAGA